MRILLADDQLHVRSALQILLKYIPNLYVVGEAGDAASLLAQVQAVKPDLVLVDFELPGLQLSNLIVKLRTIYPSLLIVALSGSLVSPTIALTAGIDEFISKSDPPERIITLLQLLAARIEQLDLP